jgi:hypothetical protein
MKALPILAMLLLVGCSTDHIGSGGLNQALKVGYGDAVGIRGEGLTIGFTAVNEDSRCWVDVLCDAAGQATITIIVAKEGSAFESRLLTIPFPDTAGYQNYTITLLQLVPRPISTHVPRPEEYVATLVVKRN